MKIKRKGNLKYNKIVLKIKKTSKSKDKTKALLSTLPFSESAPSNNQSLIIVL
jgi:hypothetical protein